MKFSRRHLLRLGQACVTAVAFSKKVSAESAPDPLLSMSSRNFQPYLQTTFVANAGGMKPTWLTLVAIDNLPSLPDQPAVTDAYILRFYSVGEPLPQGAFDLQHPALGKIKLFIVPSPQQGYNAVINHLLVPMPGSIPTRRRKPAPKAPVA